MNLADMPWIPCLWRDVSCRLASLRECLTNADITDLAVRPHERVALMRLLLCVSYAAAGIPEDHDSWLDVRKRLSEAVSAYLDTWRDSFELFHPRTPFLQVAGLRSASGAKKKSAAPGRKKTQKTAQKAQKPSGSEESQTPCGKLDFSLAAGNKTTLFDHAGQTERAFSPAWLALKLLTYQMFSPGGLIGSVIWGRTTTARSSCDGPCAPASMWHSFVRTASLVDSVHANMLSEEELSAHARLGKGWQGRPLWEKFPRDPEDADAVHNATATFLGRMVPLSRAVLLSPDGCNMLLGDGLSFPSFSNPQKPFPPEVSATVTLNRKKERIILGIQPGKAVWRQLGALTVRQQDDGVGGCAALSRCDREQGTDLVVAGVARNRADIVDAVESVFHVPGALLVSDGHARYEAEVARAEKLADFLGWAMEEYRQTLDGGWQIRLKIAGANKGEELARLKAQAFGIYWTAVETGLPLLWQLISLANTADAQTARDAWISLLNTSARDAYARTCGSDTERQMRAYVTGKRLLVGRMRKLLEQAEPGEEA